MDNLEENINCSTDGHIPRQSFDRFDDQLVENILSYLPFNKKVVFELVCKRWKTSVYNKQKLLSLNRASIEVHNSLIGLLEPIKVIDMITGIAESNNLMAVNKVWLKSILKKCKSIESLVLDCFLDFEVLDIIGRHCPHLKSLTFDTTGLNADDLDLFGQRYGHLINTLQMYSVWPNVSRYYSHKLLRHCTQLKRFRYPRSCELMYSDPKYLPELESVEDYCVGHLSDEECDNPEDCKITKNFDVFCNKYSNKLKKLSAIAYNAFDGKQLRAFLTSVTTFKALTQLELDFDTDEDIHYCINEYLIKISANNPSLMSFKLSLYTDSVNVENLFYAFDGLRNLVDLKIGVIYYNTIPQIKGSVECFKSLERLKSFEISYKHIEEKFFEDIDKHLPNLSKLVIECESQITDKTFFFISNLKKLKKFCFKKFSHLNDNQFITDNGVCAVLNGCPTLEKLAFYSRPNITNKTIETLICCANCGPKRSLTFEIFSFDIDVNQQNDEINAINLDNFVDNIPNNLKIILQ